MKIEEIPCFQRVLNGEGTSVDFCYKHCHLASDPYVCTIPHLIKHLENITHEEDET